MASENRPRFEVADVVCVHTDDYRHRHRPSAAQETVLKRIAECRTAALGGHQEQCDSCGHERISYNSCRDRHCPKCQSTARNQWVTERLERLLPIPYFHVVFTIPDGLNPLALRNKKTVFKILFAAASQTLLAVARTEKHLGAQIGFTAVLHTWGQNLLFHPHLHCVVTGGGLSFDGQRWIATPEDYFLPVKVLGKLFRGKFLAMLDRAHQNGELDLAGSTADLLQNRQWKCLKNQLYAKDWVVFAKAPFRGPDHVFHYLGRYTHRIAISNHRIVDFSEGKVTFSWKDYADGCKKKVMTLDAIEFLRRFLLHVLPKGFVRIRHYGLCASANVNGKLETARQLLDSSAESPSSPNPDSKSSETAPWWERFLEQTGVDVMACPCCETGRMVRLRVIAPAELVDVAIRAGPLPLDPS